MASLIERVARRLMGVTARRPASSEDEREFPVLAMDPDFDDLPLDHTQGTSDDEITQEAVLRLARAAIAAMREPTEAMLSKGQFAENGYGQGIGGNSAKECWQDMIDAALKESS